MIQSALHKLFTENPERWWTARQLKKELHKRLGHETPESEFNREFMILRETLVFEGKRILHWKDSLNHLYALSNKKVLITAHNHLLACTIKRNEKRKVAV